MRRVPRAPTATSPPGSKTPPVPEPADTSPGQTSRPTVHAQLVTTHTPTSEGSTRRTTGPASTNGSGISGPSPRAIVAVSPDGEQTPSEVNRVTPQPADKTAWLPFLGPRPGTAVVAENQQDVV